MIAIASQSIVFPWHCQKQRQSGREKTVAPSPINNYEGGRRGQRGEVGEGGALKERRASLVRESLNAFNQCHRANFRSPFLVLSLPSRSLPRSSIIASRSCATRTERLARGSPRSSPSAVAASSNGRVIGRPFDVRALPAAGNYQRPKLTGGSRNLSVCQPQSIHAPLCR